MTVACEPEITVHESKKAKLMFLCSVLSAFVPLARRTRQEV